MIFIFLIILNDWQWARLAHIAQPESSSDSYAVYFQITLHKTTHLFFQVLISAPEQFHVQCFAVSLCWTKGIKKAVSCVAANVNLGWFLLFGSQGFYQEPNHLKRSPSLQNKETRSFKQVKYWIKQFYIKIHCFSNTKGEKHELNSTK